MLPMYIGKKLMAISGIASLLMGAAPMIASSKGQPTWKLPDGAVQVSESLYYLGKKNDPQSGKQVEGYAFIHRANNAKNNVNANAKGGPSACYAFLATGAKWKGAPEPWIMNPSNSSGMNGATVFNREGADIALWEDAADGTVGSGPGVNVFGNGTQTNATLVADSSAPDSANEVYFADIAQNGVIAVTTVWGIFGGPAAGRSLSEWDQVYDDVSFSWSLNGAANDMDFDNIATHEIGHAFGMGHPSNGCTQETMYAYATEGETIKRDLNTGDINGINALY